MSHHLEKVKELTIIAEDKPGLLAEVTGALADEDVNMLSICAYSMEGKAYFMLVTSDNDKAKAAAEGKGWQVSEKAVVMVSVPNEVGAAQKIAEKAKDINLCYAYGTTCKCEGDTCSPSCSCRMVLCAGGAEDKLIEAIQ